MSNHDECISSRDYARLCELIRDHAGIHLGAEKRTMLEVRIRRRLKALEMDSYDQYCQYLFGSKGMQKEIVQLIDVVTTNKTDFFREPKHFEFLSNRVLPEFSARYASSRPFFVWSAGCSTGEEAYTLGMLLSEHAQKHPGFRFRILATDISTAVLEKARLGVYNEDAINPLPESLKRKYFLRSRDAASHRVRAVPELRRWIEFRHLNFMDADYGVAERADAVFCRNVIIYFERSTQECILAKLSLCLMPEGYLFMGHAETLHNMNLPLVPVAPSLYRRVNDES
ncbi:MAG: CheR family methyltransferase [Terracidiphilus sp.]